MLLCEIANSKFNPLLLAFWDTCSAQQLAHYFVTDNCIDASQDLNEFLESRGIMTGEVIPVGSWVGTCGYTRHHPGSVYHGQHA